MIGWEYPPHITGGLGIACRGIARALAARGHQVYFLLPRLPGGRREDHGVILLGPEDMEFGLTPAERAALEQSFPVSGYARAGDLPGAYESRAVQAPWNYAASAMGGVSAAISSHVLVADPAVESRASVLTGGYGEHIYSEIHRYAAVARMIARRLEFDIVHAHDWMSYPAGRSVSEDSGRPLVCHVHATERDRSGEHVNPYVYELERCALRDCDRVISVSNYTREILIQYYGLDPDRVRPVHNGLEFDLSQPAVYTDEYITDRSGGAEQPDPEVAVGSPGGAGAVKDATEDDEALVLFLGRITFQKGPDYFVQAARKVIDKLPGVRFVMAGTGDMYARMIEYAADLGIGRYFHYTGFLNEDEVRRIYGMSDLYVMPSVSEPFGITPLEAMSHGVPVILSKQSGVSEVVENCVKVDFWDVDEMARNMIELLSDRPRSLRMRDDGRREVRRITYDAAVEAIESIYYELL